MSKKKNNKIKIPYRLRQKCNDYQINCIFKSIQSCVPFKYGNFQSLMKTKEIVN